jgi:hypothetical protein
MLLLMWVMLLFASGFNIVTGQIWNRIEIHVKIWNGLDPGRPGVELLVHCKSGEDDVGTHLITPVQPTLRSPSNSNQTCGGSTLYICTFRFKNEVHRFDIYRYWRDFLYFNSCFWKIRPEGPCRLENDLCYHWNGSRRSQQPKNSTTTMRTILNN